MIWLKIQGLKLQYWYLMRRLSPEQQKQLIERKFFYDQCTVFDTELNKWLWKILVVKAYKKQIAKRFKK
jgi:hypothetical protein